MFRAFAGVLVALLFLSSLGLTAEDKKDTKEPKFKSVVGMFESYKNEKLTLKVEGVKQEFPVPGDTEVAYTAGKDKNELLKAKNGLKDIKKGSTVAVTLDGKKVLGVGVVVTTLPKDQKKKVKDKSKD
ncbi:MAG TPA: hypothetical protein VN688_26455 [Gemmataceae bacterium]|nr:hypothetical protein [Gemmataceae bacterium]